MLGSVRLRWIIQLFAVDESNKGSKFGSSAAEGPTTLNNNWIMSVHNYVLMLSNITAGDFNFLFSYLCIRLLDL